jgi:hypothetical protein
MTSKNGFLMLRNDGLNIPVIACERCGETITDCEMANVVWNREDEPRTQVTVLCKINDCVSADPHKAKQWMPLRDYIRNVAYNSGLKTRADLVTAPELRGVTTR